MSLLLKIQAFGDLLKKYAAATAHAWRHRKEMESPERKRYEAEFLPAALALQETPVNPLPRVAMWLLIIFAAIALLWAIFGRLDVVVTAQGKIVPNDRVKTIQPVETATVREIHVTDGQKVKAGDILIDFDITAAVADIKRLRNDLLTARLQSARAEGFLRALNGEALTLDSVEGMSDKRHLEEKRLMRSQWQDYEAKLARIEADVDRKEAEKRSTKEVVNKIQNILPITAHREKIFKSLYEREIVSEQDYLERKKAILEQEGELAAQLEMQMAIEAALLEAQKQRTVHLAESRKLVLDKLNEAEQKIKTTEQELIKAEQRKKLLQLKAPVDGTVQQLAVHTIGGVVTPAQPLMIIVPTQDGLEVEAFIENKDIGFVHPGQNAEIKIETFQYTKYGLIHGKVKSVSSDAIQDEKRGLVYSSRVKLERTDINVGEKMVNLSPGMAVTVEIKTGKRRVIEYFLTPLLQHTSESLRER